MSLGFSMYSKTSTLCYVRHQLDRSNYSSTDFQDEHRKKRKIIKEKRTRLHFFAFTKIIGIPKFYLYHLYKARLRLNMKTNLSRFLIYFSSLYRKI